MEALHQVPFSGSNSGYRTATVDVGSGTSTLEAQASGGSWIPVPDGAHSADSVFTFHCPFDTMFRFTLTGTATVNVSG